MPEDQHQSRPPANPPTAAGTGFIGKIKVRLARHKYRYNAYDQNGYRALTWVVVVAVLLGVSAVVWFVGLPLYRHHKEVRAIALAETYLAQNDWKNAQIRARQALVLNPHNVAATEIMAQLAFRARSREELNFRQQVMDLDPSVSNKLALADTAMRFQPPPCPIAASMLAELATGPTTNDAVYQTLAGRLALELSKPAEAELHFARAVELDPANASYAVNLSVLRLGQTNANGKAEARTRLAQLRSDPVYGTAALRALIADRLLAKDFAGAKDFSTQLLASPEANLRDQFQNLDLLHQLKSPDLATRLAGVQLMVQTNELAVAALSGWMLAHHMAAEDVKWLDNLSGPITAKLPVTVALATAYEANGNWRELSSLVSSGSWGYLEYLRFALTARAATEMGQAEVGRGNWHSAEVEAKGNLDRLRELLNLANRWQMTLQAEDLITIIVRDFPGEKGAVRTLTTMYFQAGNTAALNQLFARLSPMFPTNSEYLNNLTITSLLLKTNLPAAETQAITTDTQSPDSPSAAIAGAYALHLQHRDAAGLAALGKLKPEDLAKPSPALYYGVLLASTGKTREAAPWLKITKAKEDLLLPEEKELLAEAQARK